MTTPVPLLTEPLPQIGQEGPDYAENSDRLMRELPVSLTGFNASLLEFDANALQAESDKDDAETAATTATTKAAEAAASAVSADSAASSARAEILQANLGDWKGGVYGDIDSANKEFIILGLDTQKPLRIFVDGKLRDDYTRLGNVFTLAVAPSENVKAYGFIDPLDIAPAGFKTLRIETNYGGAGVDLECTSNGATPKWCDDAGVITTNAIYTLVNSGEFISLRLYIPDDSTVTDIAMNGAGIYRAACYEIISVEALYLHSNNISDLSPISQMRPTGNLYLSNNNISDLSPISQMRPTGILYLHSNNISDLSPISQMRPTGNLYLHSNNISDVDLAFSDISANVGAGRIINTSGGSNAPPSLAVCSDLAALESRGVTLIYTTMPVACS